LRNAVARFARLLEECRSLGIQFTSYQENIDTSTPLGQALFTIIAAVAELERNLICERVTAGLRAAGMSLRKVATTLKAGYGTVRSRIESSERKTLSGITAETAPFTSISPAL